MAFVTVFSQYLLIGIVVGFFFFRAPLLDFAYRFSHVPPLAPPVITENASPRKKKQRSGPKPPGTSVMVVDGTQQDMPTTKEQIADDAAFARELALAHKGTDLAKKSDVKKRKAKTKKQEHAEEKVQIERSLIKGLSETLPDSKIMPAHATEGPADVPSDVNSSGAAGMTSDYSSNVADRLRVISEQVLPPLAQEPQWTSVPTKNQKVQRKVERSEETKKQRQRQAQKEQSRELKEEADKKQRALMEKQRREARIARGEPAKNGEAYVETSAPGRSVWSQSTQQDELSEDDVVLLDTINAVSP